MGRGVQGARIDACAGAARRAAAPTPKSECAAHAHRPIPPASAKNGRAHQERSEILAVCPACTKSSSGGPSAASSALCSLPTSLMSHTIARRSVLFSFDFCWLFGFFVFVGLVFGCLFGFGQAEASTQGKGEGEQGSGRRRALEAAGRARRLCVRACAGRLRLHLRQPRGGGTRCRAGAGQGRGCREVHVRTCACRGEDALVEGRPLHAEDLSKGQAGGEGKGRVGRWWQREGRGRRDRRMLRREGGGRGIRDQEGAGGEGRVGRREATPRCMRRRARARRRISPTLRHQPRAPPKRYATGEANPGGAPRPRGP